MDLSTKVNIVLSVLSFILAAAVHFMSMNLIVEKAESISRK